jgi:predicted phosphodiesterase
MRLAVISDIHGNLAALQAVLADIESTGVDTVLNAGDVVGYGPEPCVRLVRERAIPTALGNHDQAIAFPHFRGWFNPKARHGLALTESLLSPQSVRWLAGLPRNLDAHGCLVVHGCPPDLTRVYLFQESDSSLARRMRDMPRPVCFAGHTHTLGRVRLDPADLASLERLKLGLGRTGLEPGLRHVVSVGSVGQPRDAVDRRAKYVLWDSDGWEVEVRAVTYDAAAVAAQVRARGFPAHYAERLL